MNPEIKELQIRMTKDFKKTKRQLIVMFVLLAADIILVLITSLKLKGKI